jgi:S-adenosylmethionine synthetase
MSDKHVFVSESVTRGHPDKLCDQISDALVDDYLAADPGARVNAECAVANGIVFIGAHCRAETTVDVAETARRMISAAGYTEGQFNSSDCTILTSLKEVDMLPRRPDPEPSLDDGVIDDWVARQQATVFGYACRQTAEFMPLPILLAHKLARRIDSVRASGELDCLLPDAKTQVAVEYHDRAPARIHGISISASADPARAGKHRAFTAAVFEHVIEPVMADETPGLDDRTRVQVNPDGEIGAGGPAVHSGLTGRKTAVDTYGEFARHSSSALSGKDPLRVERLGAYAARHAAKNVVAAGLARQCEVQLSYSIGLSHPVSLHVETYGTGTIADVEIAARIKRHFELRPLGMMLTYATGDRFADGPVFARLAAYGQVGRTDLELPWEALDKVELLH